MTDTKKLLSHATGEQWAQIGSKFITRVDVPGKPDLIENTFRDYGLDASVVGRNSVEISLSEAKKITPEDAEIIRDAINDNEQDMRPQRSETSWRGR